MTGNNMSWRKPWASVTQTVRVIILIHLSVPWPAPMVVASGSSLTISFICDSMSPMRWLSTKYDDASQSKVMVNFSGPGILEPARNE